MAKRLGEQLIDAGLVSAHAVEQALAHQQLTKHKLGDCLVELGLIDESTLLRFLAQELKTRFVSAEKLAKARVPPDALDLIPVRVAERGDVLPLAVDTERKILSVVMAAPQDQELVKELTLISGMSEVFAYVGVRAAIHAGIRKHYYGDGTAFTALEQGHRPSRSDVVRVQSAYEGSDSRATAQDDSADRKATGTRAAAAPRLAGPAMGSTLWAETNLVEAVGALVGLLEVGRGAFRAHSARVARQAGLVARALGLSPKELAATVMAAQLHELGKPAEHHLTLALLAERPELKAEAKRVVRQPARLLEAARLPALVGTLLSQQYEAFDGSGVPQGLPGKETLLGARVLAAVDALTDLTRNPKNPQRRLMTQGEALEWLQSKAGTLFDPDVVSAIRQLAGGEELRRRLDCDGREVFVVERDPLVRQALVGALTKLGLVVQGLARLDSAHDALAASSVDTLVLGQTLGVEPVAQLTKWLRGRAATAALPVLVLGEPTDPAARAALLDAGVTALVAATQDTEHAAKTIHAALIERVEHGAPGRVVQGSFDELSAGEVLRLLGDKKKSGRLTVRWDAHEGWLQLERGKVIGAAYDGERGEAALGPTLSMTQAEFQLDPDALPMDLPNVDVPLDVLARQLA